MSDKKTPDRQIAETITASLGEDAHSETIDQDHPTVRYCKDVNSEFIKCWIRLPNQFQRDEIRRKALASRSRAITQYHDKNSDLHAILHAAMLEFDDWDLDLLRAHIAEQSVREKAFEAMIVMSTEKKWEHFDEDKQRYDYLTEVGDTDTDEFLTLQNTVEEYMNALEDRTEEFMKPIRSEYDSYDKSALMNKMKRAIIKAGADDAFQQTYNQWQIFHGTRKQDNHKQRFFSSYGEMMDAGSELIEALDMEFSQIDALKAAELKKSLSPIPSLLSHSQ